MTEDELFTIDDELFTGSESDEFRIELKDASYSSTVTASLQRNPWSQDFIKNCYKSNIYF